MYLLGSAGAKTEQPQLPPDKEKADRRAEETDRKTGSNVRAFLEGGEEPRYQILQHRKQHSVIKWYALQISIQSRESTFTSMPELVGRGRQVSGALVKTSKNGQCS